LLYLLPLLAMHAIPTLLVFFLSHGVSFVYRLSHTLAGARIAIPLQKRSIIVSGVHRKGRPATVSWPLQSLVDSKPPHLDSARMIPKASGVSEYSTLPNVFEV
jgi:hypothetical protein